MSLSIMLNLKLHIKTDVMPLSGMWRETHFTTAINIFQSVIQKGKVYLHTKAAKLLQWRTQLINPVFC